MHHTPIDSPVDDTVWWELDHWPGTNRTLGDEPRIAAWLARNKLIGQTFTTDELREALGHRLSQTSRNDREHFQRRIRQLRSVRDGWVFPSVKHDKTVESGTYRLDRIGWHPALGQRPPDPTAVSAKTKREVLERDHYRCFHCGVGAGEPYPDDPDRLAVMTVGHVVPAEFGGTGQASNLRIECAHCNEASRSATSTPESLPGVRAAVNNLTKSDRTRLLEWVATRRRGRNALDDIYDRARLLSPGDHQELLTWLQRTMN